MSRAFLAGDSHEKNNLDVEAGDCLTSFSAPVPPVPPARGNFEGRRERKPRNREIFRGEGEDAAEAVD
jgi:hypothetical protein